MNLSQILSAVLCVALLDFGIGQAPCNTPVDVVFLVLSHGSMMSFEYNTQRKFVLEVADRLGVAPGQSQAAVVQYGDSASLKVRLGQYSTMRSFTGAVNDLRQQYDIFRRFDKALSVAGTELRQQGRRDVPKLVLLITNGYAKVDRNLFKQSAQPLKNQGVYIIALGVGYAPKNLLQLVTVDDSDIFMIKRFEYLKPNVGKILHRACYLIEKCASNPCRHGARCVNVVGTYRCDCKPGYSGRNCETNINECGSSPCRNGGTCTDLVASYRCDCKMGYSGKNCQGGDGCVSLTEGDQSFDEDVDFVPMSWFDTPSVVHDGSGGYQILGRHVHMNFTEEHLKTKKKINIGDNQASPNNIKLKILADTVFVQGNVAIKGIRKLTIFSRRIAFLKGSQLDLSAPHVTQRFGKSLAAGDNGAPGKQGADGPSVELYTDLLEGYVNILTNGGNGHKGQNGKDGDRGISSDDEKDDRKESECPLGRSRWGCTTYFPGYRGEPGGNAGNGGNAGTSGNGGNAGSLLIHVREVIGKAVMKTCPGKGAPAAKNGKGGTGGQGGLGGRGLRCKNERGCTDKGLISSNCWDRCVPNGYTGRASRGTKGRDGRDGRAGIAGKEGDLVAPYIQKSPFGRSELKKYPLVLIKLMTRYAEDLIWANKIVSSQAVLNFIIQLTEGRADAAHFRKVAKRRLTFLNKEGFDRFGRNKLFAPVMKWEAFKKRVATMRDRAKSYEDAYNTISSSIEDEISEIKKLLPNATLIQVRSEMERVVEARRVARSQKKIYVATIGEFEQNMKSSMAAIDVLLPSVYEKSKFNKQDLFVVLQGITGFLKDVKGKDPLGALGNILGVIGNFASKCNTGTLKDIQGKLTKWMTFGKAYTALENSSDLDFDQMDITTVPEMMKANLEMNKQGLTTDLVCLLEERLLPRHKAKFEELIERFFIAGSARIDLIAKVMELDNDIGEYNFNIENFNETVNDIEKLTVPKGTPIEDSVKEMFLDDLLTSYQEIESRFAKHLYHYYKSFEFRSLWNVTDTLANFQRRASEAAKGTGKLAGIVELTKAMEEIDKIENKGEDCFSNMHYALDTRKWHFNDVKDKVLFSEIHNGSTTFSLGISDSCKHCYNVRLLKMYVELYGDNTQNDDNYPGKVYLKLRHMSGSYFRDGEGNIREFRQKPGSFRTFEYNRFAITNTSKCIEERQKGIKDSLYCMGKDDSRFHPMCCHFLSDSPCDDKLLGAVECQSPFGAYELSIPIDKDAICRKDSSKITDANCKDFDRTQLTKMNVWIHYMYWSRSYPTGPDDVRCGRSIARAPPRPMARENGTSLNQQN